MKKVLLAFSTNTNVGIFHKLYAVFSMNKQPVTDYKNCILQIWNLNFITDITHKSRIKMQSMANSISYNKSVNNRLDHSQQH
jgi:hypothetical protein